MPSRWLALEGNPEVLTKYIHTLGVDDSWSLVDVFGLDDEMLAMLPQPVAAFLLVYPAKDIVKLTEHKSGSKVFFLKQTIENACGTVALLNALGNLNVTYKENSSLDRFFKAAKGKSPDEIAQLLEADKEICEIHASFSQQGQTPTPSSEENVDLHFVALVLADGHVQELDGRNNSPLQHAASDETNFVKNAAVVCKQYMSQIPNNLNFSLVALAKQ